MNIKILDSSRNDRMLDSNSLEFRAWYDYVPCENSFTFPNTNNPKHIQWQLKSNFYYEWEVKISVLYRLQRHLDYMKSCYTKFFGQQITYVPPGIIVKVSLGQSLLSSQ